MTISCIVGIVAVVVIVGTAGSVTINRRKQLKNESLEMSKEEITHISGSLTKIKEQIDNNSLEESFMSETQMKSVIDLYNIANKLKITNNDLRMQQLIYNICLVKNQANPLLILFGNGHQLNFYELVMEMEVLSILINFGLIGFILYLGPFIAILIYTFVFGIKNIKKIDSEYIMLFLGSCLGFVLSLLTGYVFFSLSTNIIIIIIDTILIHKIENINT